MSIHARCQLFLIRPSLARSVTRNLPVAARRMHSSALTVGRHTSQRGAAPTLSVGALLTAGVALVSREAALCQELDAAASKATDASNSGANKGDDANKNYRRPSLKDEIDLLIDQMMSRCGEISLAGGLGFCSGYALKQVGKAAAITIGTLFVIAQVAQSKGYIEIHWHKVEKDVVKAVDPNGDGKITKEDLHEWYKRLMKVLQANLPSSAGFAGGFLLGVSCS